MKHYLKLVNFEWNRFNKLFLSLAAVVFTLQLCIVLFNAITFRYFMPKLQPSEVYQLEVYEKFSLLNVVDNFIYLLTMVVGIVGLLFYIFFIWYRDWFARTSFAYRLFTLPISRMSIFYAKLTVILMSVFSMLALELIFMKVFHIIIKLIIPISYRIDLSLSEIIRSSLYLEFFYPSEINTVLLKIGFGIFIVVLLFTLILIERSYRWIGILYGFLFFTINSAFMLLPLMIQWFSNNWFFKSELLWMELCIVLVLFIFNLIYSRILINKKISV